MDLFTKYAKTKIAIKRLELDMREMEMQLKEEIEEGFSHKTIYGTISKYTTKRWLYNDDIKLKIKDIQAKAIKKGKAEQVESIVIKYTPPKGL